MLPLSAPDADGPARVGSLARVLSASSRAIIYAEDREGLAEDVCRIAVETGGFRMAWVGLIDPGRGELQVAGHFGVSPEYVEQIHIALSSEDPTGRGPTGIAMAERRPVISQDVEHDPAMAPWRDAARLAGFRSSAAVPLIVDESVIGALSVYAPTEGWFDAPAVELLKQLADDLALGLGPRAIERAVAAEARSALFGALTEAVVVLDHDLRIIDFNPAFAQLVGGDRETLLGATPPWPGWAPGNDAALAAIGSALETGGSRQRFAFPRVGGEPFLADMTAVRLEQDGRRTRLLVTLHDVTELEESKAAAEAGRVTAEVAADYLRALNGAMVEGLCAVDPDGIVTYVNPAAADMLGWPVEELVGRNAHDTFHPRRPDGAPLPAAACPSPMCAADGGNVKSVRDAFVCHDGSVLNIVASFASFATPGGAEGRMVVFNDAEDVLAEELRIERELEELSWVGRVRDALDEDRLVLYAQPIGDAATGAIVQHELLLRLRSPDGAIVEAHTFLPAAEHYGLMTQIDQWVVRQAVAYAARGIAVSLNLSGASFADGAVLGAFESALRSPGVDPALIVVEVTETAIIDAQSAARSALGRFRAAGCRIAIDDFGTGYGGLTYAKQFPVDILKIDAEFVRDAVTSEESRSVVRAVVSLARGLELTTVAEGVEDAATLALMREVGVDHIQGYHLGRPVPAEEELKV